MVNESSLINKLFEEGLMCLHYRKPYWTVKEHESYMNEIDPAFRDRVMIHQDYDLCLKYKLRGIHLTEKTKGDIDLYKRWEVVTSMACHSLSDLVKLPSYIDYATISPLYDSISKSGYKAGIDKQKLKECLQSKQLSYKVYALGGINESKLSELKNLGLDGVCVLGDFWNRNDDSKERILHLKKLIQLCR